jgi:hypothetical protein
VGLQKNVRGTFASRGEASCDAAWKGLDDGIMDAENRAVKRTDAADGSGRAGNLSCAGRTHRSLRGVRNEWWSDRIPGLLPSESLPQAAYLYVEKARFDDRFVLSVDERQIFFG